MSKRNSTSSSIHLSPWLTLMLDSMCAILILISCCLYCIVDFELSHTTESICYSSAVSTYSMIISPVWLSNELTMLDSSVNEHRSGHSGLDWWTRLRRGTVSSGFILTCEMLESWLSSSLLQSTSDAMIMLSFALKLTLKTLSVVPWPYWEEQTILRVYLVPAKSSWLVAILALKLFFSLATRKS